MAEYEITHTTKYHYAEPVSYCHNTGHLIIQSNERQKCSFNEIIIEPYPAFLVERNDYFGNKFCYFSVEEPHKSLSVTSKTRIETFARDNPPDESGMSWETAVSAMTHPQNDTDLYASEFTHESQYVPKGKIYAALAESIFTPGKPLLQAAHELAVHIFQTYKYDQKATNILTSLSEVIAHKKGVCQDFTHLSLAILRSYGISARYVSGYLETFPPDGKEKLRGTDASHAWFSVYLPGQGWFDFDPTNGKASGEEFIVTATGRDFGDVSPLKGILFGGGKHILKVEVDVFRLR